MGAKKQIRMNRSNTSYNLTGKAFSFIATVAAIVLLPLLSVTSCNEREEQPERFDKNEISLNFSEGETFSSETKSSGNEHVTIYSELLFRDEKLGDFYLEVLEEDIQNQIPDSLASETKGAPYSGNNIGSFTVTSYVNGSNEVYFTKTMTSDGSTVSTGHYWPISTPETALDFFGYAKSNNNGSLSNLTMDPAANSGTFTYTLPDPSDNSSATAQPDLLFALAADKTNNGAAIPLDFYHALSSIAFNSGSVPSQFKVKSIAFTNVSSSADCSYSLNGSSLKFSWTGTGQKKQFKQAFDEEVGGSSSKPINTDEETFMMIPQSFGNDSEIIITVSFEDREYPINKKLSSITSSWEPGKKYTYRISSPNEVEVEIHETFTEGSNIKRDVFFTNTGLSTIKIRAAIVGYWVVKSTINGVEQECIIADWDPENHGTFDGLPGTGWTKNATDGYYYYNSTLSPKANTNNLFNSYTLTTSPPVIGAELVLTIVSQAIINGYEDSTWNKAN